MINLNRILKSRDRHRFADQILSGQNYGFSSSHVWMWDLDHKESWALKNWCFWTVVLEKTLGSPLDCKEIKPVNLKGNQYWIFIGRANGEAEMPILWPPHAKNWLLRKDPDAGKYWREEKKGMTGDEMVGWNHWFDGHEFEQALRVGEGQGGLACCSPWDCRVGHDWETELTEHQQEFTGGSDCRCVRNSKRTRVRSVTLRCDCIAAISWKNVNGRGVASYCWVNKVVS